MKKMWKTYQLDYCDICGCICIVCPVCGNSSCNGSGCDKCIADFVEFIGLHYPDLHYSKDDIIQEE